MKTILVPTDFSDGAFNALIHALELAKLLDYNIEVIHAYSMPTTGSAIMVNITEILEKNALEELELLKQRVNKLPNTAEVVISYRALHGPVVDVINRLSKKAGTEFVVMGTQGASGITDKWLGTNASDAVRHVEDPLLVVPSNLAYKNIDKIMFATDLKVVDNEVRLRFISELAKVSHAKIEFLHIKKHGEEVDQIKLEEYRSQLNRAFGESRSRITFQDDDQVDEGIHHGIETHRPDILVLVRHDYGFFEGLFRNSMSRKLISESKLPILVLQDK